jgi:phospholipid/cholesterol/gamma-HCH transport system substrate-binding protein
MNKQSNKKVWLGAFVTAGLIIFIVGIYFIGQKQMLFSSTIRIKAIYNDVNGLEVGDNVRFTGIDVGTVADINILSDTSVEVSMAIDKSVKKFIKKDAKAAIVSEGLMGDKIVILTAGSEGGAEIANNDIIQSTDGSSVDAILRQVKISADNIAAITGDLSVITGNIKSGRGAIGKLFMDTVLAENLGLTMANVEQASGGLRDDLEAAKHSFLFKGYFKKKEKAAEAKKEKGSK